MPEAILLVTFKYNLSVMAAKIIAFIGTLLISLVSAIVFFFGMLVVMNGFSESDATWGLGVYAIISIGASLLMSVSAVLLTGVLIKRQLHAAVAAVISILAFSLISVGIEVIGSLIGVAVADYVRVNY